ncbi:MAG: acyl-CoA thioesterase [Candidatus Sulfotelmatobacter sp.]
MIFAARLAGQRSILRVAATIIFTLKSRRFASPVEKQRKRPFLSKTTNITNRKTIHIEWGDCDPAQIVFYPRYLAYFDACTTALFMKAGLSKRQMLKTHKIAGIPLVDLRVSFKAPSRFSDTVVVESEITEWRRSSFCVRHRLLKKNVLAVECFEIRVWAATSEADPERIEGKPVPREVVAMFSAEHNHRAAHQKSRRKK